MNAIAPLATLDQKWSDLQSLLRAYPKVLVAFSGGVDSAFVLRASRDVLGTERVLALTALSDSVPEHDRETALRVAESMGVEHLVLTTRHMEIEEFVRNEKDRCFFCKQEVYSTCRKVADERGITHILDGTNADDLGDIRPGMRAARDLGVLSPLVDAGLSKPEIRELSRRLGLETWDRPASPCLSSRFPHGTRISVEGLSRVGESEAYLRQLGFKEFRVRYYEDTARIEVDAGEFGRFFDPELRENVKRRLKELGFRFVCLDLESFRSGRLARS